MVIGKIIRLNAHADYVCQVPQQGEVDEPPRPADYAVGTFVRVELANVPDTSLVGLAYNTVLLTPGMGMLGPRLVPAQDIELLSPDLLGETAVLIGIAGIGTTGAGGPKHGLPVYSPSAHCLVEAMSEDEVRDFHGGGGQVRLAYAPFLLANHPLVASELLLQVLGRLKQMFPNSERHLTVLRNDILWGAKLQGWAG